MPENTGPPAPKCPTHKIFMQFKYGEFPHRWYYCPTCHDHWIECGICFGHVELKRAHYYSS
jgi:hypothetical protein